tara:strand:+ start:2277 stop:2663 length:387 start_codon:yes stop_codon:yes gene_type:complete
MKISVPISVGELFDKISILEIKKTKIKDKTKLQDIKFELNALRQILTKKRLNKKNNKEQYIKLFNINKRLWNIEDKKRSYESSKKFDKAFIELARKVYLLNDRRAKIKNKINQISGSMIREVKSYEKY